MSANTKEESAGMGGMLTDASFTCAAVVQKYGGPTMTTFRGGVDVLDVTAAIEEVIAYVADGDLADIEKMLVSQAIALQSMFVTLAQRAEAQKSRENIGLMATLAFKAQAQSRATLQTLIDLKFPRSTVFAKQANIANGNQQVNNGPAHSARKEIPSPPIEVLAQGVIDGGSILDAGATLAAITGHRELAPVGVGHRAKKRGGKSHVGA